MEILERLTMVFSLCLVHIGISILWFLHFDMDEDK